MKPFCGTFQVKAVRHYFHVVLFIMLYNVVLSLKSADKTLMQQDFYLLVVSLVSFPLLVQFPYSCPLAGHLDHPDSRLRTHNGTEDLLPEASVSARDTALRQRWPGVGWEDHGGLDPGRPSPRMRYVHNISRGNKHQFYGNMLYTYKYNYYLIHIYEPPQQLAGFLWPESVQLATLLGALCR